MAQLPEVLALEWDGAAAGPAADAAAPGAAAAAASVTEGGGLMALGGLGPAIGV